MYFPPFILFILSSLISLTTDLSFSLIKPEAIIINMSSRLLAEDLDVYKKASVQTIIEKAKYIINYEINKANTLFNNSEEKELLIPHFQYNELILGRVIGRGGFGVVRELNELRLLSQQQQQSTTNNNSKETAPRWKKRNGINNNNNNNTSQDDNSNRRQMNGQTTTTTTTTINSQQQQQQLSSTSSSSTREYLARRVYSKKGGKYVVKLIENELIHTDRVTYLKGVIDLSLEAKYLLSLHHPHIISLRGLSYNNNNNNNNNNNSSETTISNNNNDNSNNYDITNNNNCNPFFVILDHLPETLPKRLNTWMHLKRATRGITGFVTGSKKKVQQLLTDRLLVAYDIAEAMDYIHTKNVVYRDIKPDNIGFDCNGVTKIFDFGLAKELTNIEQDENGLYLLTGLTGAIRYMAPEVGLGLTYNQKADIYSWSMLMWYIMALEPPMGLYTPNMFIDRVFQKGYRPATKDKWSTTLCNLLKQCWSDNIYDRPSFRDIMIALRKEVHEINPNIAALMENAWDD